MLSKTKIALALAFIWGYTTSAVSAQALPDAQDGLTRLDEVTVSSTRTERRVDNVPNTVTVITAADIEQEGAQNIRDVFRNELDVTVRAAPARFTAAGDATGRAGNESIAIRGLEGNQVLMMVDGIRIPNSFSFGAFSTGRGDFLDVTGIKTAEVLRGPASTQYGSDGLAGAVSFRTPDPGDLLKSGQSAGGFVQSGYAGADRSWSTALGVAGRNAQWQGLLLGSYRQGHETSNKGGDYAENVTRTAPNPLDYSNPYLLGKAVLTVNSANTLGVTAEAQRRNQDTEVYSARPVSPLGSGSVIDLDTHDQTSRNRFSVEHRFNDINADWFQRAESRLYWQDARVSQLSEEQRDVLPGRTRDNTYQSRVFGFSTVLETSLNGWLNQRLSYGVDWSRADVAAVRDGTVPPYGEVFPVRPFPDTTYTLSGAFVQSELEFGIFSVIPGVRFDHYRLSPSADGYAAAAPVALSGQAVTPRLGFVWQLAPSFAPYGQIAQGFRAPTPEMVNNGFTNRASGYTSVGNANLKPEYADSLEIGLRGRMAGVRYSLAAFDNRYTNFISQQLVSGAGTPADPSVFQYINLADAHIQGVEARTEWQFGRRWTANAGIAYSEGHSVVNGVKTPLDTIQPIKAVIGLRYDADDWGTRVNFRHSQGKQVGLIAPARTPQFAPPAYNVVDLGVYWKPARHVTVNANLNNVLNASYWRWPDVRGLADNTPVKDAYTAPGRNAQLTVRLDF